MYGLALLFICLGDGNINHVHEWECTSVGWLKPFQVNCVIRRKQKEIEKEGSEQEEGENWSIESWWKTEKEREREREREGTYWLTEWEKQNWITKFVINATRSKCKCLCIWLVGCLGFMAYQPL